MTLLGDAELLDEVAAFVFGGSEGGTRLEPLLERWNDEVGSIREDDGQRELLQAIRTDWALCDVPAADGRPWLRAALDGELGPVPDRWRRLTRSHVGLFEVFPGRVSWLRDLRAGLCVPVLEPLPLVPATEGPAAVWEARVVLEAGSAVLARPPLAYPFSLLKRLVDASETRFSGPRSMLAWPVLRRGWLQFSRARRIDPSAVFRF